MRTSTLFALVVLAMLAIPISNALAQKESADGPVGIFSSGAEYDQFMRSAKELAYGENGTPELQSMIPMLNDIALNKPMGWSNQTYGGPGSTLDLLSDSKVREELEVMDDQYKELQEMNQQVLTTAGEQLRALDFSDRENLASQFRKIRDQAESDLNSVLLPHQIDRLKQLRSQSRLHNRSFVDVITNEPYKTELEISDKQSTELRESEREIQEELEQEIAKLREKAREKLLSKLKKPQREKVVEIFGETFDFGEREKREKKKKVRQKKSK